MSLFNHFLFQGDSALSLSFELWSWLVTMQHALPMKTTSCHFNTHYVGIIREHTPRNAMQLLLEYVHVD